MKLHCARTRKPLQQRGMKSNLPSHFSANQWVSLWNSLAYSKVTWTIGRRWSQILWPLARHQPKLQDHGHGASVLHGVPVYFSAYAGNELYCLVTEKTPTTCPRWHLTLQMASIEPAFSNRKSNAPTTTPPSHTLHIWYYNVEDRNFHIVSELPDFLTGRHYAGKKQFNQNLFCLKIGRTSITVVDTIVHE